MHTHLVRHAVYTKRLRPASHSHRPRPHDWLAINSARPSTAPSGSVAHFSLNSFSACCHTRTFRQSFNCIKLGNNAALKASDASLGSRDGRWSMLMTLRGKSAGDADGRWTGTVGRLKVVLMS